MQLLKRIKRRITLMLYDEWGNGIHLYYSKQNIKLNSDFLEVV